MLQLAIRAKLGLNSVTVKPENPYGAFPLSRICLRPAEVRRRAVLLGARLGPGPGGAAPRSQRARPRRRSPGDHLRLARFVRARAQPRRSEEHTSELQSPM